MEKNIYDLIISELIVSGTSAGAGGGSTSSGSARLDLTNSLNIIDINAPVSNVTLTYTSQILNIPAGYTIFSHTVSAPVGAPETSTSNTFTTNSKLLTISSVGLTFQTTSVAVLKKTGEADITLTATNIITGVAPMYFGVKTGTALNTTSLNAQSSTKNTFELTSGTGRLYIVLPTTTATLLSVTDSNGLIIPISSFTATTNGSLKYYILNWDTEFTGTNKKQFTLNFN
jgi:hypothetical protein